MRIFYEVYGHGEPTILLLPTWSIIHSRGWKAQVPYLARHARVVVFDGRGNGRSDRPQEPAAYHETEFAADALAVLDATETERAVRRRLLDGRRSGRSCSRREHPGARRRRRLHRARPSPLGAATTRRARRSASTSGSRPTRAGGSTTATTGVEHYRDFLEFFFCAGLQRAALDEADRGRGRLGPRDDAARRSSRRRAAGSPTEETRAARGAPPLPRARHPRDERRGPAARLRRGARRGRPAARSSPLEGSGHAPHARDPVKVNLLLRDFACPPPPAATLAARPVAQPPARAVHLLADRPRPRAARRGDRRRAAPAPPRPRDRLARPAPGHGGARGARRADPPGERARSRTSRPTSSRESAEHDLHCFQALAADGRDPRRELHGLPRPRPRRAVRPLDRRRGVGARLLPAREPGAEARRVRLADRLRRLAADAGRRRARGVPDRRLQRRDDRAHRPLPAAARPGDLRRRARRHRPRRASAPSCRRSATGPSEHFDFAGYVTGFDPAELARPRARCAPSSATAPDEAVCIVTVGGSGVGADLLRRVDRGVPGGEASSSRSCG